jgi:hypothetical protein
MARPNAKTRKACEAATRKGYENTLPKVGTRKNGVLITKAALNYGKKMAKPFLKNAIAMCRMSPEQQKKALKKMFGKMVNRL